MWTESTGEKSVAFFHFLYFNICMIDKKYNERVLCTTINFRSMGPPQVTAAILIHHYQDTEYRYKNHVRYNLQWTCSIIGQEQKFIIQFMYPLRSHKQVFIERVPSFIYSMFKSICTFSLTQAAGLACALGLFIVSLHYSAKIDKLMSTSYAELSWIWMRISSLSVNLCDGNA